MRILSVMKEAITTLVCRHFVPVHSRYALQKHRLDTQQRFQLMTITVASKDSLAVRDALTGCAHTNIVSFCHMHCGKSVKFAVRFPQLRRNEIMRRVLACVPSGEIGCFAGSTLPLPHRDFSREVSHGR